MRTRESKAERQLNEAIEQTYYRLAQGVQVNILDIPKIFRDAKIELAAGVSLEQSMPGIIARYKAN
jgi:hypothetical protein